MIKILSLALFFFSLLPGPSKLIPEDQMDQDTDTDRLLAGAKRKIWIYQYDLPGDTLEKPGIIFYRDGRWTNNSNRICNYYGGNWKRRGSCLMLNNNGEGYDSVVINIQSVNPDELNYTTTFYTYQLLDKNDTIRYEERYRCPKYTEGRLISEDSIEQHYFLRSEK